MSKILSGKPAPFKKTLIVQVKVEVVADTKELLDDLMRDAIWGIECAGHESHYDEGEKCGDTYGLRDVKVMNKKKIPRGWKN